MGLDASQTQTMNILNRAEDVESSDKYQCRLNVKLWTTVVRRHARSGDTKTKSIMNALSITLIFSLDDTSRQIVENAIPYGELDLEIDDDCEENTSPAKSQLSLANEIVQLAARDPPTDGLRRMVEISQAIYSCEREKQRNQET